MNPRNLAVALAVSAGLAVAFLVLTPTSARAQASCHECDLNFPLGSQCRVVDVGAQSCAEAPCRLFGMCSHPQHPQPADTAASHEVVQYPAAHASLRKAANGRLFLLFDSGKVSYVNQESGGELTVELCRGGSEHLSLWVASFQLPAGEMDLASSAFALRL